jgi:hypothetical protein
MCASAFTSSLGLHAVLVHAALQISRWQWARLGFDFATNEGLVVEGMPERPALPTAMLGAPSRSATIG